MPPSPGHIHQLPVKVLYSLDGANQSYLTVLSELQDVYIHPGNPGYGSDDEPGPLGSTLLKALAQGVCHASPECVPSSSLDFSVYALDPTPTPRQRSTQPFAPHTDSHSWGGKGFLSWAISEPSNGTTLIKGRLVKEYDFDLSRFSSTDSGGGLEGLMRLGGGGDGRGWGLEVVITLKMVNPGGKGEFSGRREFERMLYNGQGASGSVLVNTNTNTSTNTRNSTNTTSASSPVGRTILPPPPPRSGMVSSPHRPSTTGPGIGSSNTVAQRIVRPPSRSSLPPSSIPMAPSSSSQAGPSRPTSSSTTNTNTNVTSNSNSKGSVNDLGRTPQPSVGVGRPQSQQGTRPTQASSSTAQSLPPKNTTTPPKSLTKPQAVTHDRNRDREVTPPPLPRPRSPPPTTPHRRALRDLLQADGKMSPSLAKDLVNNPSLLALLKSIPSTVKDGQGSGNGKGKGKEVKSEQTPQNGARGAREGTPTPTGPKAKVESIPGGCFNCGTMETTLWRVKAYADGTKKKVCDACGLYFNKHKKMRPKELWEPHNQAAAESSKRPHSHLNPTPPPGVRHSPRLSRQYNTNPGHASSDAAPSIPFPPESPSKRRRVSNKPIPQPSPRMATRSTARDIGVGVGVGVGVGSRMDSFPFSSPGTAHSASFGFGTSPAVPLDQSLPVQNRNTNTNTNSNSTANEGGGGIEDMDIDALLAQLTNGNGNHNGDHDGNGNGNGNGNGGDGMDLMNLPMGINLEELFATVDHAAEHNEGLAEDMMKFLAGLEEHTDVNGGGEGGGEGGGGGNEQGNENRNTDDGGNGQDNRDSKRN